jgi:cytochrome c biogenesis protein CcdA
MPEWPLIAGALWLGVLTSISPCPLATNIAAISFVGKQVGRPLQVLLAGLLYTLGRTLTYVLVALIVVTSALSSSSVSMFLQNDMNKLLGPLLLLVGVVLLDVIPLPLLGRGSDWLQRAQLKVGGLGLWGAGLLGMLFALTFCPVSAALYFGSLVPLAIKHQSSLLVPSLYGLGTALPVVAFAVILAFAANRLSRAFDAMTAIERWMRRLTAVVFIGVGVYYILIYLVGVL